MNFTKIVLFSASLLFLLASCSSDETDPGPTNPVIEGTIWSGADITFAKEGGTNPSDEANQDRITDNVWITRGLQGQIYNAKIEFNPNKEESPMGTAWAVGTSANIQNLTFAPFRTAVEQPRTVVGKSLVMHLIDDDIYIDVMFTSWDDNKEGGFSYTRSTE